MSDEIERLRAELAAATERMSKLDFERTAAELERDALRALLKEALDNPDEIWGELGARIDALLNKEPK